ncbi:DUF4157 domain-containing protein [Streptomyces sp. PRKS01-65]|nr:DUF4157 domain-containing protein [Streptomyces harenosi]NEY33737.1 DUF4157 domain-containing protein [Streptomyces harenosi]
MSDHQALRETGRSGRDRAPAHKAALAPRERPAGLLALQAAAGNAAVVQRLRRAGHLDGRDEHPHGQGPGEPAAPAVQRSGVHDVLRAPGSPLDETTRADMEARLGADFSDVRVHTGAAARASAAEIGARAYTSGNHVVLGAGGGDRHTLAHELTHVVQQRRGPVAGTDHGGGFRVSDPSDRFEREAEATARRALSGPAPTHGPDTGRAPGTGRVPGAPVQRAAADGAGLPVIQRWTDGTMSGDDPVFQADHGRAGSVEVRNLHGKPLGAAANSPSVEPIGWAQLRQEGYTKMAPGGEKPVGAPYRAVRMHLFNGRLGGPGDNVLNLAPGPGKLNSQMSAQAEDPVKLLVELGNKVWLRTTVGYQDNNTNAANFASVVPNQITMEWGVEGDPASHQRWSSAINLPVDPLNAAQVVVYSTWGGTAAQLVQEMSGANVSDQMRAQVLGLVPNDQLKLALLDAFPTLYQGAEGADQARYILLHQNAADRVAFLRRMGLTVQELFPQALQPLYRAGAQAAAAEVFTTWGLSDDDQRLMVFHYGEELLLAMGVAAGVRLLERLGDRGYALVKYYSEPDQMVILDALESRGTLGALLQAANSPAPRNALLDRWAAYRGHATSDAKKDFIDATGISPAHKTAYRTWRDQQDAASAYRSGRPTRAAAGARR